jgi:predicted glycoside hydrolase/deacetylase ChbG (UPF0249 family)
MPRTLAERLGFAATDRIAIVHCDDIGMCHAANAGAFAALESGPATCGSIMVPCPWFREAAQRARENPGLDLGVHLTLNAEYPHYRWGPVAGAPAVPSLVDGDGCLPLTALETAKQADPAEVEIELRAQVDRALDAGIDVTHLDAHMGTCFLPPFAGIYAALARDYRLPVFAIRPDPATLEARGLGGAARILEELLEALEAAQVLSSATRHGEATSCRRSLPTPTRGTSSAASTAAGPGAEPWRPRGFTRSGCALCVS